MHEEVAQVLRKLGCARQAGHPALLTHQNRNDDDVALQRGGDLVVDIVTLAVPGLLSQQFHPAIAHHGDEHVAARERLIELTVEALAGEQVVDVHEDVLPAELAGEPVANAASISRGVVPAIADENPSRHALRQPLWRARHDPKGAPRHRHDD